MRWWLALAPFLLCGCAVLARMAYRPLPLPTRFGARHLLPEPVLPAFPDLDRLHRKTWSLYFAHLRWPRPGTGFPRDYVDEAFSPHLFQWDTCFMMLMGRYAHRAFPAIVSLDNFYAKQHPDGFICRELDERTGKDVIYELLDDAVNPPLFAWAEWEYYRLTGDASRFPRVLPILVRYYDWLRAHRRTPEGFYWNTPLGSGMDNSPREGEGWICMTAQQALAARSLAAMAARLGRRDLKARFTAEHRQLAELINTRMWDPKDRCYYDVHRGKPTRVKTVASFWPLLAGVVPPPRVAALAAHARDPKTFARPHRIPTLAADHPRYDPRGDYWRGAVWTPTTYMVALGFARAGRRDVAQEIATSHLRHVLEVFRATGTVWENYSPEKAAPGKPAKAEFVGWTGLAATALLYEIVLGFEADGAHRTLTWHLHRTDHHGIRRLWFGGVEVSLTARARPTPTAAPTIDVETDRPFTLHVVWPGGEARKAFPAGRTTWKVESR